MTTALAEREPVAVSGDQLDLVKRTVANGATDAELKLFLFDCQRRGVHPLDKLLHFTKRGGKYTPVTSIDFMRSQAAMSGEMAGSDDPVFVEADGKLVSASVTVYRLTQGQRFGYAATARWSEYCPDNAPMWKRMPHTMLGKCAEALALRKAFPQQLAGLYSREEMDQAEVAPKAVYAVSAPIDTPSSDDAVEMVAAPDDGQLRIATVEKRDTKNVNVKKYVIVLSDGREVTTIREQLGALAETLCQDSDPVTVETKDTKWGVDLLELRRASSREPAGDLELPPLTDADIPF